MIKLMAGLFGLELLTLLLTGCGEQRTKQEENNYSYYSDAVPTFQPGIYRMNVSINDFRPEVLTFRPNLKNYFGNWELDLNETGKFTAGNNDIEFEGFYRINPGEIIFYGTNWLSSCYFSETADEVDYRWYNSGSKVVLTNIHDDCFERSMVLSIHEWEATSYTSETPQPGFYSAQAAG